MWHLCEAAAQPWAAATVYYEAMHVCLRVSVRVDMLVCVFACTYIILLMSHEEDETPSVRLGPRACENDLPIATLGGFTASYTLQLTLPLC